MHWADAAAHRIVEGYPVLDEYRLAAGISPSGPVHVGNLRDVATVHFVARGLADLGKRTRAIFSWDDFDRFRKVPAGIPADFEKHLGRPLADVPDPARCHESYAAHFERAFEDALGELGITFDFRRQAQLYRSGLYDDAIVEAVRRRDVIFDILNDFRTRPVDVAQRAAFYPLSVYCAGCGTDNTQVLACDPDARVLRYRCRGCGHEAEAPLGGASGVKLPWKIDWPMRWRHEGIVFEPGGKDHATQGGSYDVSSRIAREVFRHEPPIFQPYEFVGIRGMTGKMSSSSGMLLTPAELLSVYQPELLLWLFAKTPPTRAFDISLDDQILRSYDEFDRDLEKFRAGVRDDDARSIELCLQRGRDLRPVPFRQLTAFSAIVGGNRAALEAIFRRLGLPSSPADFGERLAKAEHWVERYAPDEALKLRGERDDAFYASLSDEERRWLADLVGWLGATTAFTADEASERLYDIPKRGAVAAEIKARQKRFFEIIYQLLFGQRRGPRLGTFFAAFPTADYLKLLSA